MPDAPYLRQVRGRCRTAGGLASLGVGASDVVATMLPNCVEMVLTLFAAWRMVG